jgi:hypothetical protein
LRELKALAKGLKGKVVEIRVDATCEYPELDKQLVKTEI